ncbi:DUF4124 domain-containing protein [Aquipseudomonas alcaligenes]|jgi:uncharacterized protein involved in exopolysaccharide biosynthesis|uniref:DUF4124 domain-containing protein n=1 Tax=Aquipseudomonas alcaligenes TaxID=43263 RepID=A0AA37CDG1_AQUAC|nr:DUF4124 domain-containing protein [Pseudomonas alcaligenes]MDH1053961.1 DUF4124 domain-containing protein [Pseudomonas alcaligenes]BCR26806.1 hypothetical protein KAM426_43330 [Pseudomonas alcaligenes]GIZ65598.1 hypothetical protein KAM428_06830 [Pseudomonas alcaligenes]GIZ69932.1 hypothetical protein KAM429_06930 [Pseudomonas alcaligenes]GIZ74285.1 hypothetical protein KAM430_06940 [Pseudomonas alcaligenes]
MLKRSVLGLAVITGLCSVQASFAAEFYRYVNDKGVTVLDRLGVPPEYIEKGYQVVDDQGRVVREIPPAPSKEERQRQLEEKAKVKSDIQLLRIYSEPADVDRARDRKLAELDGVIGVAHGNLSSLRTQQANLQAKAAEYERSGRQVPEHLLVQIDNLKAEQAGVEQDIQRYQQSRKEAEASFAADRARLVELRGE